jgi:MFS family permease
MVTRSGKLAVRDVGAGRPAGRWWALAAISVSALVVGLDLTVLSLALPTIGASTGASTGDLQWITDSYALVMAALILPAGLLGDAYGRKRVLLASLVVFAAASAWVAYSAGIGELIAARAVLGVGAAAVFPMAIAVIPVMFAEHERQKAVAAMAAAIFVSYPIGPIFGGFLLDHFWWGSVFLINVPVVAIALVAVARWLPESRAASRPRLDVPGVVLSSAALAGVTYGFIRAGEAGWTDAVALSAMAAGVVGSSGSQPRREAAGGPAAVPGGRVQVGHNLDDDGVVLDVWPDVHGALVLPGHPRRDAARQRGADAAAGRRHARGHGGREPAD